MAEHRLYAVMLGLCLLAVALLPRARPRRASFESGPKNAQTGLVSFNKLGTPRVESRLALDQPLNPSSSNVPTALDTNPLTRSSNAKGRILLECKDPEYDPSPDDYTCIPADVTLDPQAVSVVVLRPLDVPPNNATIVVVKRAAAGVRFPFASVRRLRAAFGVLVLLGIGASAARSFEYRDERILWQNVAAREPNSFRAWWGLGSAVWRYGDVAAAIEPLARAHLLCPAHYEVLANYAEALISLPDAQAQPFRALLVTDMLAARGSEDAWARTLQAQARLQAGRTTGEREYFEVAERQALSCLQIAQPKGYVYRLAAEARRGLGDLEGALAHLDASIARGLDHFTVRLDRAAVLRDLGRHAEARRELLQAQQRAPMEPAVMQALQQWAQPPR